jgi:hypothetical protein
MQIKPLTKLNYQDHNELSLLYNKQYIPTQLRTASQYLDLLKFVK